jgi:hypothetical protein
VGEKTNTFEIENYITRGKYDVIDFKYIINSVEKGICILNYLNIDIRVYVHIYIYIYIYICICIYIYVYTNIY